jgi:hypothetical protein
MLSHEVPSTCQITSTTAPATQLLPLFSTWCKPLSMQVTSTTFPDFFPTKNDASASLTYSQTLLSTNKVYTQIHLTNNSTRLRPDQLSNNNRILSSADRIASTLHPSSLRRSSTNQQIKSARPHWPSHVALRVPGNTHMLSCGRLRLQCLLNSR